MLGSPILEVAIGLVFVFLLFSLIASACLEFISGCFSWRAKNLEQALLRFSNTLHEHGEGNSSDPFRSALAHPLITSIANARPGVLRGRRMPSYIPSRLFALAVVDSIGSRLEGEHSLRQTKENLEKLDNTDVKRLLLPLLDHAGDDMDKAIDNIESWFNSLMERASGWYKRKAQLWIFMISLFVVFSLNVDSIMIVNYLWRDSAIRVALVEQASNTITSGNIDNGKAADIVMEKLESRQLPLGWNSVDIEKDETRKVVNQIPATFTQWFYKLVGLLVSTFAVSLGAPFWFELLNKLVNLRSAGTKPGVTSGSSATRN